MPRQKLILRTSTLAYPLLMVLAIWVVLWVEFTYGYNFNNWGIQPRTLVGLRGIIFAPFIHAGIPHALSNSLPLFLLGVALFYFYEGIAGRVFLYGLLLTGFLTWLIGQTGSTHIGASGVAYVLFSFLFFKGLFSRNYRLIALSLTVVFIYGSLIWGIFPGKPHISWEGHLSGFFTGILLAIVYRHYQVDGVVEKPTTNYISPEEAEFLRHFDEDGNFIPSSELERREHKADKTLEVSVKYQYLPNDRKKEEEN